MSKGPARRIRLRAVVAYPAVSVALVAAVALALTPFGPSQVTAFAATATPTEIAAVTGTATDVPSPTTTDAPSPTATDTASPTASPTATDTASPTSTDILTPTPSPSPTPSPASEAVVAPGGVSVDHHVLARFEGPGLPAAYLALDALVPDASQFQTLRVRFQMRNTGTDPIITTPQLEYRVGAADFLVVPVKPEPGIPLHMTREWVAGTTGGTVQGPLKESLAVADFLTVGELGDTKVVGHHSMSVNPDLPISLPPTSFTEEEFTVSLSIDAQYDTTYELRVTDGGTVLAGTDVTSIHLGAAPMSQNSLGQRQGVTVEDPSAVAASGLAYPLLNVATAAAKTTPATTPAISPSDGTLYPLASGSLSPAVAPSTVIVVGEPSTTVHGQCEACHRGHTAEAPKLLAQSTQSALCFSCHDGSAAATAAGAKDVKSQYALDPANVPSKREYYSHDVITSAAVTPATARQSDCADCHNSHRSKATPEGAQVGDGVNTPPLSTGWGISGPLTGVSGVSVVNGAAGEAPTYENLDGIDKPVTREYQLCFKCHSGAATLTSNTGLEPSQYALDKAVEFNPANPSFHPVEVAGTNGTDKMKASLAGQSPYKLWNFNIGSTVRCLNCHASGATPEPSTDTTAPQPPAAGGDLAPHTSSNRGILLRNYLDRELKPRVDSVVDTKAVKAAYSAGDFALCYVCHGEEPFANAASPANSNATNFAFHGLHLTGLKGKGDGGTDVDVAGAGQGNAICAECHFRIHSTTNKVGSQVIPGSRLVNFAPDVQPAIAGTPVTWTAGAAGTASCTLTCHGYTHVSLKY
jgi:predicted CXXCH cytochrome family protein